MSVSPARRFVTEQLTGFFSGHMAETPGKRKSAALSLYDDDDEESPPVKRASG
ncbi:hypothetical protein NECAME_18379, partial [Necator americanus]